MTLLLVLALLAAAVPADGGVDGRDTLQLAWCYREAEANHPLRAGLPLQRAITDLKVRNLEARRLPVLSLGGQAAYQSEVPSLPLALPEGAAPAVRRDQYRVALGVDQLLYDGGLTAGQRELEAVGGALAQQQVAVALYGVRGDVDAAFFGVLLRQVQGEMLAALAADLRARRGRLAAQVAAGAAMAGQVDVLAAELIRVEQQAIEADAERRAALEVLAYLVGHALRDDVVLVLPDVPARALPAAAYEKGPATGRPEHALFHLRRTGLAVQAQLAARRSRPVVSGFAEAAYGRPQGLDLFDNAFGPFYSAGVRVRWSFWDWQTHRRERDVLALEARVVETEAAVFEREVGVAATRLRHDAARLEALLRRDDEVIALRERIAARVASQLEHGVLSATDYVIEKSAEHQARLTRERHRIELAQVHVAYRTLRGDSL